MSNGIIILVNLQGKLGKTIVKEETIKQRVGANILEKTIKFNGKEEKLCTRKTNISGDVVDGWIKGRAPFFIKEFLWKNMSKTQRLKAWVERFDEGFGVSYQEL